MQVYQPRLFPDVDLAAAIAGDDASEWTLEHSECCHGVPVHIFPFWSVFGCRGTEDRHAGDLSLLAGRRKSPSVGELCDAVGRRVSARSHCVRLNSLVHGSSFSPECPSS